VHRFAEIVAPSRLGRSFRWLLASSWVTNLGDGITPAAGPLLVASQTRNPLAVAMAALLQRLPWLLSGLTASILVRRVDVAVVLAALFLFGVTETFGETTSTTLLPMLVDKHDLGIANSRAMTGLVVWNQLAGPPVGFGLISTAMAVGGLLGAASYGWLERHLRLGVIMRGGLIIETLTHLALALTRWAWFALIVFVIFGAHAFIWGTTSTSVRQRAVPAQFQGRVGSVYLTGVAAS
jgi:Transmembrane secretion effector